jgi:peptidyl-prolyl cis-trans isomerase D
MAIITKIQEKAGVAAGVIAVSLAFFLLGSDLFTGSNGLFGGNSQGTIGEIAGQEISAQQYQTMLENGRRNMQQRAGQTLNEQQEAQLESQVWEQLINDIAVKKELDKLGIKVGAAEQVDLIQGDNIDPTVQQYFMDPTTRQFDKNNIIRFLKELPKAPKEQRDQWLEIEKSIFEARRQQKYIGMLVGSAYTTTAEAKRLHEEQNAKANARYLFVPYFSMPDSTVKVSDDELQAYLNKHKTRYKGQDTRTFDYVVFGVIPSKTDTTAFYESFKQTVKDFAVAANDSGFAQAKSELPQKQWTSLAEMSEQLQAVVPSSIKGAISDRIYKDGEFYTIFKFKGTKQDTSFTARASHILLPFNAATSDSAKAAVRRNAADLLKRIQEGANFEVMARQFSQDGSAQNGGDLGFFKKGMMVKPFEDAVVSSGMGLIPRVVETQFGCHIIKVTAPKSNTLYNLLTISRKLEPSNATRDEAYRKSEEFISKVSDVESFKKQIKENKGLYLLTASRVSPTQNNINGQLTGNTAREMVRWAFSSDTDMGQVSSKAFEMNNGNAYAVAVLTGKSDKDKVSINDFKDELSTQVRNEKKAEQISNKLKGLAGTLEQIASKYGSGALVETVTGINFAGNSTRMGTAGPDPVVLGKIFGMKAGQKSKPVRGDQGIFLVESLGTTPAPAIADYTQYKNQGRQLAGQMSSYYFREVVKEAADIVDNRGKQ